MKSPRLHEKQLLTFFFIKRNYIFLLMLLEYLTLPMEETYIHIYAPICKNMKQCSRKDSAH